MKQHIDFMHKNITPRPSVITESVTRSRPKNICIFNLQPNGCKKGLNCTHSHETNNQLHKINKIPKLCYNGPSCNWMPVCRYIHQEDGESLPARAPRVPREESRRFQVKQCYWSASECPRGGPTSCSFVHMPEPIPQGFVTEDRSQPPPGYSLTEYPGLPAPRRPSIFQQNGMPTERRQSKY